MLVAKIAMISNRMFKLNVKTAEEKCLQACINDSSWIWHMRFGHLNFEDFKMLGEKYIVRGVPKINHPNELCEACLLGKHGRKSFPKSHFQKQPSLYNLCIQMYLVRSIHNHSVAISRNVEFEEDVSWNWNIEKGEIYHFLPHLEEEENEELEVEGYCDSDYAGDVDDHKSTIRFVFYFGENAISFLRKQPIVTISTCESKYVATIAGTCHAIWLRRLLSELYFAHDGETKIMVDNKSAIALVKNSVFHDRSKHTDVSSILFEIALLTRRSHPNCPKCIPSTLHTENSKRGFFPPCFIS
ncbi:hypothetical protein Sango_1176300 [Sesamum angolense]|uniref:GAG-pre-integrase domain-containing protein n=1 Tax=Sesamum angolense TaxID=2727404 RepID=A0AAE1WW57_9LAMI|nr:hypothetical protein Sango_1176300 [Sesamum angolense]